MPALSHKVVNDFTFPLPPLEIQEQIVAELDGYQRIIDGARAVIENYKPMIRIYPEWEIAELGNIASFTQGIQIDLDAQLKEPKD